MHVFVVPTVCSTVSSVVPQTLEAGFCSGQYEVGVRDPMAVANAEVLVAQKSVVIWALVSCVGTIAASLNEPVR